MKSSILIFLLTSLACIKSAYAVELTPIPEPGTLALFASAGISLFIFKKLKK